ILFSPATRAIQERYGSRDTIARMETRGHWKSRLPEDVISFIRARNSFYIGTASCEGRPYIQHRGGPTGFIHVLDQETLAWPEFKGNRQHITAGNLSENNQAFIFLMDYSLPRRIKLWGRAEVVEDSNALIPDIRSQPYYAKIARAIRFTVEVWDENCRQYIPDYSADSELMIKLQKSQNKITSLENEIKRLRQLVTTRPEDD
ncbi:MAG TPA: pyridoxamine 5'-phosphate oxidase family protein, partial [Gammaproteobacteria bacterium]|nr:pyridoxamine 5'-phosphate oxidase family protein [Gammaproteobacteria bacterium]